MKRRYFPWQSSAPLWCGIFWVIFTNQKTLFLVITVGMPLVAFYSEQSCTDDVWVHRLLMSLKLYLNLLAGFRTISVLCVEILRKSSHKGWNILTHRGNCHSVITDHNVSNIVVCVSCCSLWIVLLFWGNTSEANHRLSEHAECDCVSKSLDFVIAVLQVVKAVV